MSVKHVGQRYSDVNFRFLGYHEDTPLKGQVLFRKREMVLDIKGGDTPYLIVGKPEKHWFQGFNSAIAGNSVDAKWALVGATYVGTWIEMGTIYLFSFEIKK